MERGARALARSGGSDQCPIPLALPVPAPPGPKTAAERAECLADGGSCNECCEGITGECKELTVSGGVLTLDHKDDCVLLKGNDNQRALSHVRGRRALGDLRENGGLGRGRVHAARGSAPAGHGLRSGRRRRARRGGDDLFDGARRGRREHVPLGRGLFERVPRVPRPGLGPVRLGHRALRPHARLCVRVADREDVQPPGPAEARRGLRGARPLRDARLPPRVARGHRPASRGRDDLRETSEASRIR